MEASNGFGDTPERMSGILKEKEFFPVLQRLFHPFNVEIIQSSSWENKNQKVDYWGFKNGTKICAFDFKTSNTPETDFKLTYKINNSTKHSFEVGYPNILSIFLLNHIGSIAFVSKKKIYQWLLDNKPVISPSTRDNSTFFRFPTSEISKLASNIVKY